MTCAVGADLIIDRTYAVSVDAGRIRAFASALPEPAEWGENALDAQATARLRSLL
jgi:hypothetical protein